MSDFADSPVAVNGDAAAHDIKTSKVSSYDSSGLLRRCHHAGLFFFKLALCVCASNGGVIIFMRVANGWSSLACDDLASDALLTQPSLPF